MKLNSSESKSIVAGASISGTLINSLIKGINIFLDIGRYVGSGIRMLIGGKVCEI